MGFFDFMTEDIAIDLGTANTLIIHNDKVVIDTSIVAVTGSLVKYHVGKEANLMQGKHENINNKTFERWCNLILMLQKND
jgi:rod shape-determining protein MreB